MPRDFRGPRPTISGSQIISRDVDEVALMLGKGGTIPAATAADTADFAVTVPFNLSLTRLKAVAKTAPTTATTMQLRRSTDNGATFANAFGTVQIAASATTGVADPADLDVNEGDVLDFSVTVGGGSGTALVVEVVGARR